MTEPASVADSAEANDLRTRIVAAAAQLIASGGRDAVTTRAVAAAAGVQAPTIYRLFGDKRGLLEAVAEHVLDAYIAAKSIRPSHPDPVQDLREGWDIHIAFGLAHPGAFSILVEDPHPSPHSPAARGYQMLQQRIRNIALAGRLRVSEERAASLLHAAGIGTVLSLLSKPEEQRDPGLSDASREAVVTAITGEAIVHADSATSSAAATLRASLEQISVLSAGERHLLEELLDRISDSQGRRDLPACQA